MIFASCSLACVARSPSFSARAASSRWIFCSRACISDRLKDMYNTKLNEAKAAHRQEIEKLSAGERSIPSHLVRWPVSPEVHPSRQEPPRVAGSSVQGLVSFERPQPQPQLRLKLKLQLQLQLKLQKKPLSMLPQLRKVHPSRQEPPRVAGSSVQGLVSFERHLDQGSRPLRLGIARSKNALIALRICTTLN
jgi:hypothetical protein